VGRVGLGLVFGSLPDTNRTPALSKGMAVEKTFWFSTSTLGRVVVELVFGFTSFPKVETIGSFPFFVTESLENPGVVNFSLLTITFDDNSF